MNTKRIFGWAIAVAMFATTTTWGQQVPLEQLLGENNSLRDPLYGISVTYPAGWQVRGAARWGKNNAENTISFQPVWPLETRPSLYYQPLSNFDAPKRAEEVPPHFRYTAGTKAQQRVNGGLRDYRNDESTFELFTINGRPAFRYRANFTVRGQPQFEYFVRVLGTELMAMFFVQGPAAEFDQMRREVDQIVATVQVP